MLFASPGVERGFVETEFIDISGHTNVFSEFKGALTLAQPIDAAPKYIYMRYSKCSHPKSHSNRPDGFIIF